MVLEVKTPTRERSHGAIAEEARQIVTAYYQQCREAIVHQQRLKKFSERAELSHLTKLEKEILSRKSRLERLVRELIPRTEERYNEIRLELGWPRLPPLNWD
jgi:hypothetical protein